MKYLLSIISLTVMFLSACKSQNSEKKISVYESIISKNEFDNNNALSRFQLEKKNKNDTITNLFLNNGETIFFKDNLGTPYDENSIQYRKVQSKKATKFIISVQEYERDYFLLLDKDDKSIDTIPSYPYFSKDKNIIFVVDYNPYETYNDIFPPSEDVYIYKYVKKQLQKVYFKPYHFFSDTYLESFFWKDQNILYLKFISEKDRKKAKYISLTILSQ
ncbi:hypothetical protein V2590_09610 [Tenacibaculum maritimum]|uniref:Lipoprotein n=4 Tax=Tenacibaculum maritimum TaxID=107401 RepID=A0A2H1EAV4_9FLAO|nr:hypothetical protein [Tenacibaculum maritimum]MDB0602878.1 hypothetical protein [Tenacibaculum maritimum]SFZ83306.1 protein of unknown function [Tenacibaculum maritimum NCIMB 2154]SFZ84824.1 protein of unknown function [Tenacibaculum maritimum NCIMB 2154]